VSHNFLDHFCRTVCRISVPASDIAGQVGLDFITESKLDVVTAVSWLFWIVTLTSSFRRRFLYLKILTSRFNRKIIIIAVFNFSNDNIN
jgi:hypothetical protein